VHAVDISPDLNLLCANGGTNQRRSIVAADPLKVIKFDAVVAANVSLVNNDVDDFERIL
jgi:hypothetical protein